MDLDKPADGGKQAMDLGKPKVARKTVAKVKTKVDKDSPTYARKKRKCNALKQAAKEAKDRGCTAAEIKEAGTKAYAATD